MADVFKNLKELCLKIYHLDPAKPFSVPVLAWEEALKKAEVKVGGGTDFDMLLMKKEFEKEYVAPFIVMQKLITNVWKIMIRKNRHVLHIGI